MHIATGNIWDYWKRGFYATVPINIGWKRDDTNVMGRGVAYQAAKKFPGLSAEIGARCHMFGTTLTPYVDFERRLVIFPTKPLNVQQPWLSWQQPSSLELISRGIESLKTSTFIGDPSKENPIAALPLIGCGNGQLDPADVFPVISQLSNQYILVLPKNFDQQKLYAKTSKLDTKTSEGIEISPFLDTLLSD